MCECETSKQRREATRRRAEYDSHPYSKYLEDRIAEATASLTERISHLSLEIAEVRAKALRVPPAAS